MTLMAEIDLSLCKRSELRIAQEVHKQERQAWAQGKILERVTSRGTSSPSHTFDSCGAHHIQIIWIVEHSERK